jgi:hypothetical protein
VEKNDRQLKDYSSTVTDINVSAVFKEASIAATNLRRARVSVVIISSFAGYEAGICGIMIACD